jgi:hypothetical protein
MGVSDTIAAAIKSARRTKPTAPQMMTAIGWTPVSTSDRAASASTTGARMINIESADGVLFIVPANIAEVCGTIKDMLEDVPEARAEAKLTYSAVSWMVLRAVLEFCISSQQNTGSTTDFSRCYDVPVVDWQLKFIAEYNHVEDALCMVGILMAANYFHVEQLVKLTGYMIAGLLRDKTVREMRAILGIENTGFTPEEQAAAEALVEQLLSATATLPVQAPAPAAAAPAAPVASQ